MPKHYVRAQLREAIGDRSLSGVCAGTIKRDERGDILEQVKNFQVANLLSGKTDPWNVRVRTAQMLCDLFPFHLKIQDFYKERQRVTKP